jgi:indole-3-glycerol phosphate synthase
MLRKARNNSSETDGNILSKIVNTKKREIAGLKRTMPVGALQERLMDIKEARDFRQAIDGKECAIIAEVKKHSPSLGSLKEDADHRAIAVHYEKSGAAAISVLTDQSFFHGTSAYLTEVKNAVCIPVLRKDFIIDIYQIYEARVMGADALLLIVRLLPVERLAEYIRITMSLGMCPLVEVHSREELTIALAAGAEIIGINNRNLKTFQTNIQTSMNLAPFIPAGKTVISESGIRTREDVKTLMQAGIHVFLIGEALMLATDPGGKLSELLGRGAKL